jgi:hypothetical protein
VWCGVRSSALKAAVVGVVAATFKVSASVVEALNECSRVEADFGIACEACIGTADILRPLVCGGFKTHQSSYPYEPNDG